MDGWSALVGRQPVALPLCTHAANPHAPGDGTQSTQRHKALLPDRGPAQHGDPSQRLPVQGGGLAATFLRRRPSPDVIESGAWVRVTDVYPPTSWCWAEIQHDMNLPCMLSTRQHTAYCRSAQRSAWMLDPWTARRAWGGTGVCSNGRKTHTARAGTQHSTLGPSLTASGAPFTCSSGAVAVNGPQEERTSAHGNIYAQSSP